MINISESRKRAEAALERTKRATEGPWFWNSYSGVFSGPWVKRYDAAEQEIPDAAPDEDPRWDALPEPLVASVPPAYGDTATGRHAHDAVFIAEARTDVPQLAQDLLEALEEIEQLNNLLSEYRSL
jgi:hypothetical protein